MWVPGPRSLSPLSFFLSDLILSYALQVSGPYTTGGAGRPVRPKGGAEGDKRPARAYPLTPLRTAGVPVPTGKAVAAGTW